MQSSSMKYSGDNINSRLCLLISILGVCVLNSGDYINANMLLSLLLKEIKILCVAEPCRNIICGQGYCPQL